MMKKINNSAKNKQRADVLVAKNLGITRNKAQAMIMAGEILANGKKILKPGQEMDSDSLIAPQKRFPYVSRGALKLERAYQEFKLDFKDKTICDVGASTGGFTDFSLQRDARKVYAIDTGYGQIDQKLRLDNRVILMEKTNIKNVKSLPDPIDFFVIDVSFISLKQVLPAIKRIIENCKLKIVNSNIVMLVKPQFEVGKTIADKHKGIIKDKKIQFNVVKGIGEFAEALGFTVKGITESPITGVKGNREFLVYLTLRR